MSQEPQDVNGEIQRGPDHHFPTHPAPHQVVSRARAELWRFPSRPGAVFRSQRISENLRESENFVTISSRLEIDAQ